MKKSSYTFLAGFLIVVIGVVAYGIYFNGEGGQASIWSRAKRAATKVAEKSAKEIAYEGCKGFFGIIGNNVSLKKLGQNTLTAMSEKIKSRGYAPNLASIKYGFAPNIQTGNSNESWAITDCYNIYFGGTMGKAVVEKLDQDNFAGMTQGEKKWLLHELAHTDQCYDNGAKTNYTTGRKNGCEKWFSQVGANLLKNPGASVHGIHDVMPLEEAAETWALSAVKDFIQ